METRFQRLGTKCGHVLSQGLRVLCKGEIEQAFAYGVFAFAYGVIHALCSICQRVDAQGVFEWRKRAFTK